MNNSSVTQETEEEYHSDLSRELSLFQLTMLGVGKTTGGGIFLLTSLALGIVGGGGIFIVFVLNGLIALFSSMSFAELASSFPGAGGAYTYLKKSFGSFPGFMAGWINWFAYVVSGSLYAVTFSIYLGSMLRAISVPLILGGNLWLLEDSLTIAIIVFFTVVNYLGAGETGNAAVLIAMIQTGFLGFIGVMGITMSMMEPVRLTNFSLFFHLQQRTF